MKDYIEERAVEIAYYIIENKATVRQTAVAFGVSKSTIHKDVTERLLQINPSLAGEARKVLDLNKSERHIRGGLATREKYLHPFLCKKMVYYIFTVYNRENGDIQKRRDRKREEWGKRNKNRIEVIICFPIGNWQI